MSTSIKSFICKLHLIQKCIFSNVNIYIIRDYVYGVGVLNGSPNPDPISDETMPFSIPVFRPDLLSPYPSVLSFQNWLPFYALCGTLHVKTIRPLYPMSNQNDENLYPFSEKMAQNHILWATHNYIAHIGEYRPNPPILPPPPPSPALPGIKD